MRWLNIGNEQLIDVKRITGVFNGNTKVPNGVEITVVGEPIETYIEVDCRYWIGISILPTTITKKIKTP